MEISLKKVLLSSGDHTIRRAIAYHEIKLEIKSIFPDKAIFKDTIRLGLDLY
jgi:hypothetical protein